MNSRPAWQPQPSFEDESLSYFLQEYSVQPGPGVFRGHLDFLEDMYQSSHRDSCLRRATLAAAYMSLSRHYKSSTLYFTARNHYGAALRAVNRDLSGSPKTLKDETLVSLMFLGMIEDVDCEGPSAKSIHMLGISKLYDAVGHRLLMNIDQSSVHGWIFTELQIPSVTGGHVPDCLAIPEADLDLSNPSVLIAVSVARIGQFYRSAKRVTGREEARLGMSERRAMLGSAMREAMLIQSELAKIAASLPPMWRPQEVAHTPGQPLLSYESRWTACICCLYNVTLILFYSRFLLCCGALRRLSHGTSTATPEKQLVESSASLAEAQLKALTHMICATMPYLMGAVDEQGVPLVVPQQKGVIMYHLIWPLAIVIVSPWSSSQQVESCRARLNWIRDRYGIKLASVVLDLARDLLA
ncbi:hypothetical protein ACJ41O_006345 [Fusarium nematophilum]